MRCLALCLCLICFAVHAQESADSVRQLQEITVKAFAYDRPLREVPVAVSVIGGQELNRFSNTSFLPVVNMVPGVKMEERSPGSYRFAIRGSSLRSPFGVRNVKFYWNGLPLTDGGGNTYLNIVDFNSVGNMEIIKGPGSSLYGAGTGGVVLLQPTRLLSSGPHLQFSAVGGNYGLLRLEAGGALVRNKNFRLDGRFSMQRSDGYRQQTKMSRGTFNLDWTNILSQKSALTGTLLISGINYQTPGGLTKAQYDSDPSQARPRSGVTPGAVEQNANVNNNTSYLGLNFDHQWSESASTRIGFFGSQTKFINPTIRNYEERLENNWGGRTDTQFAFGSGGIKSKVTLGAEYQGFYSTITDYDNLQGTPGNIQTDDQLWSQMMLAFGQWEISLPKDFFITVGGSGNFVLYNFNRISVTPEVRQERSFEPVFAPRIAILKKLSNSFSVYANVSNGFSPPTLAEVRPSTATFNNTLNAERGTNYEAGLKAELPMAKASALKFNLAIYNFELNDAIVIQRDITGADYFINAGGTIQQGVELNASWERVASEGSKMSWFRLWASGTYNHYWFSNYVNDGISYSGNALTGVSPLTLVTGADLHWRNGLYFNLTANYTDRIPLNDANTDYASDYFLVGDRLGYKLNRRLPVEFFIGIDNALDQKYSLGNDLNAVGGRYYNASAPRNYYAGIVLHLISQMKK